MATVESELDSGRISFFWTNATRLNTAQQLGNCLSCLGLRHSGFCVKKLVRSSVSRLPLTGLAEGGSLYHVVVGEEGPVSGEILVGFSPLAQTLRHSSANGAALPHHERENVRVTLPGY